MASGDHSGHRPGERLPRGIQRNHGKDGQERDQAAARGEHAARQRPAGAPPARQAGGLQDQPAALGEDQEGLSAGRVQSVATRMVVDREQEIEQFEPEEYWFVDADLRAGGKQLHARLIALDGERVSLSNQAQADAAKARVEQGGFVIRSVKRGESASIPPRRSRPPICSRRPAESSASPRPRRCRLPSSSTRAWTSRARHAGPDFLHPYRQRPPERRAVAAAREAIAARYGAEYVPEKPNVYKGARARRTRTRPSVRRTSTCGRRKSRPR